MSLFVAVTVKPERCSAGQPCMQCITVCPVTIFESQGGRAAVIGANEDECMLCDLCLEQCPTDAIAIHKLYTDEVRTAASLRG